MFNVPYSEIIIQNAPLSELHASTRRQPGLISFSRLLPFSVFTCLGWLVYYFLLDCANQFVGMPNNLKDLLDPDGY